MILSKTNARKLNQYMTSHTVKLISKKFNVTTGYIRQVLRGEHTREDIIEYAIDMAKKEKRRRELLNNKISSL